MYRCRTESLRSNAPRRGLPTLRGMVLVLFASCALLRTGMAREARPPSTSEMKRWVRDLRTGGSEQRKKARKELVAAGPIAAGLLVEDLEEGSTRSRREVVKTLARIDSADADWALADRAVLDRDSEVRERALAALKKGRGNSARDRLVELVQDPSARIRQRAAETILAAGAPGVIEQLIQKLETELPVGGSNATLHIRATNTDFRGYDDFSTTHRVPIGGGKTRTVTQKHMMPVIGGTTIETTVVVGLSKALKEITGQRFGDDVNKWKAWWHVNRGAFERSEDDGANEPGK